MTRDDDDEYEIEDEEDDGEEKPPIKKPVWGKLAKREEDRPLTLRKAWESDDAKVEYVEERDIRIKHNDGTREYIGVRRKITRWKKEREDEDEEDSEDDEDYDEEGF